VKRRYVVAAVVASGAILAAAVVGVLAYQPAPTQIVQAASGPTTESGVVYDAPKWVRKQAEHVSMGHAVGQVDEVYGVATTTVERWIELEPSYAGSVKFDQENQG
jgi:hypothetical protein